MSFNVILLRNRNNTKLKNYIFGGKPVSRLVVIDSYQVPRAADAWPCMAREVWPDAVKNDILELGYVQISRIERIKAQCFKFLNQSRSLKILLFLVRLFVKTSTLINFLFKTGIN